MASVTVPAIPPTLNNARPVKRLRWLDLHTIDVSPSQRLDSQAVQPVLTPILMSRDTNPLPCIVTHDEPVPPSFDLLAILAPPPSADATKVALPTHTPLVTAIRLLLLLDSEAWHATAVSDVQIDTSHRVSASLAPALDRASPRPAPTTVSTAEPDAARFFLPTVLPIAVANDIPKLKLPARMPPVATTPRLPPVPCDSSPRSALSDTHSLAAQPLFPAVIRALSWPRPSPAPSTVTLLDPEDPTFATFVPLTTAAEYDAITLKLPARFPSVTVTPLLPLIPPLAQRHRTALSDVHSVDSLSLIPCREPIDQTSAPRPLPATVMLVDPVMNILACKTELDVAASKDIASLLLPAW